MKRIAVFHNYFGAVGGGEKVAVEIARTLGADIITTDVEPGVIEKLGAPDVKIISLGRTIKIPSLKQISASWKFRRADFSRDYDIFIFSGEWATFAAARHQPNFYYCHTPPRFFYDLYRPNLAKLGGFTRLVAGTWADWHRKWDQKNFANVQKIFCNSEVTRSRIQKFYGRSAEIIYPFVDCQKYSWHQPEDFWLAVNRIYPEKRIELQIEAFRRIPHLKLLIVGGWAAGDHAARYYKKISRNMPENVKMLGEIPDVRLVDLYRRCRGLIATAVDEDFGLAPLEAMASGRPVVAVAEGGFRETVIDNQTGFLVAADVPAVRAGILLAEKNLVAFRGPAQKRAREYDVRIFREKIKQAVTEIK